MTKYLIPINTFAEYFEAKESRKMTLLKQHIKNEEKQKLRVVGEPTPFYGNTSRSQIVRTILNGLNHSLTEKTIKNLRSLKPDTDWKKRDQKINIDVLERFKEMSFPEDILGKKLEKIKPEVKSMPFYGIYIKIVPTLTFRVNIDGEIHIGACMVHSSKQHKFSVIESKIVATLLSQFLSACVLKENEIVNSQLCFCIDTYAGTVINSNNQFPSDMKNVKLICSELRNNWSIAEQSLIA
jgi:hypothetical protein